MQGNAWLVRHCNDFLMNRSPNFLTSEEASERSDLALLALAYFLVLEDLSLQQKSIREKRQSL